VIVVSEVVGAVQLSLEVPPGSLYLGGGDEQSLVLGSLTALHGVQGTIVAQSDQQAVNVPQGRYSSSPTLIAAQHDGLPSPQGPS